MVDRVELLDKVETQPVNLNEEMVKTSDLRNDEVEATTDIGTVPTEVKDDIDEKKDGDAETTKPALSLKKKLGMEMSLNVRMKLMDHVEENQEEKCDGTKEMVRFYPELDEDREAMEHLMKAKADWKAERAMEERLALMESIEAE